MATSSIRVLVVDDSEPFRRVVCSILQNKLEFRTIVEASDGVEAIELAQALQPDLILLDIGLPKLNGIEAARRIRDLAPQSKILFVSQESSVDVVQTFQQSTEVARHHEAGFYSDDRCLLDDLTEFIGAALTVGNAAIVVATESHRDSLLQRLQAYGSDIGAALEQGRYISLDAADTLSTFMLNGMPDPVRFLKLFGSLIATAAEAARGEQARVAVFGEMCHLLWAQGNAEAAIQVEKLGNQLAKTNDVDILCGYSLGGVQGGMHSHIFQRICAEHSAVHSR